MSVIATARKPGLGATIRALFDHIGAVDNTSRKAMPVMPR